MTSLITGIPYAPDKNLGGAYNAFMERLAYDDWACLLDHDAMLTTRYWYPQLLRIIEENPEAGLIAAMSNRIGNRAQQAKGVNAKNHDVVYHRRIGASLQEKHRSQVRDVTNGFPIGGVMMVLRRKVWQEVGGFVDGLLCVDHRMHLAVKKSGRSIYIAQGVYMYHWRRAYGDGEWLKSAPKAECPCSTMRNVP